MRRRDTRSSALILLGSLLALLFIVFLIVEWPSRQAVPVAGERSPGGREPSPPARTELARPDAKPEVGGSTAEGRPAAPPGKPETARGKAAVIMDDLGYNIETVQSLCSLKRPVTASILPYEPFTREAAEAAHECGLEIMLHLPLESPVEKSGENAPGTILSRMSGDEIRGNILSCLDRVPWRLGANNHTGSKVTESAEIMAVILAVLKDRGFYFIDSRTTSHTVASQAARLQGVPTASRDVFLDDTLQESAIRGQMEKLFRLARDRGRAVGICHPKKETFAALEKYLGLSERYGVELVFASEIVE